MVAKSFCVKNTGFQHTAARRRLRSAMCNPPSPFWFQHTAARRRLKTRIDTALQRARVSTHSRAKAADWHADMPILDDLPVSTHSRAKAAEGRNRATIALI